MPPRAGCKHVCKQWRIVIYKHHAYAMLILVREMGPIFATPSCKYYYWTKRLNQRKNQQQPDEAECCSTAQVLNSSE